MDKREQEAAEIHSNEWFKTFINFVGRLDKTYQENKVNLPKLQKKLKTLIKDGQDMIQSVQVEVRERKTKDEQLPVDSQKHSESVENKGEEKKISADCRSSEEVQEKKPSSKELKDADKRHAERDKSETPTDTNHARYLEEELGNCKRELEIKNREIDSLMERIAHYSDRQTKQDQRDVEDTLSQNRQSRVEQDFKAFTSDERIDACQIIQRGFKEKTDINDAKRLTCVIFETVYEYFMARKAAMTDVFKEISKFIVEKGPMIGHHCVEKRKRNEECLIQIPVGRGGSECSRGVLNELLLSVKESAPKIDTSKFMEVVKEEIISLASVSRHRSSKLPIKHALLRDLEDYLRCCIKLTWRMVTQVPPMRLEYQNFTFKRELHKVVGSPPEHRAADQEICYLWPGLMDGGGRTISRGEVIFQQ